MKKTNNSHALTVAVFFGGFQAIMPLLGWFLGTQFEHYITRFDHWIALILLSLIGGKMLLEACKSQDEPAKCVVLLDIKELTILAVATSIDALAVGITFAFLKVSILPSIAFIGITTFILSFVAVTAGNKLGTKFKSRAEIAGGLVLILIGVKIFLDHLGIL